MTCWAVLAAAALSAAPPAQAPPVRVPETVARCAALTALRLPDVRFTDIQYAPADAAARGPVHAAHCRATGVIGTEIGFTVRLPDAWNDRFLMVGGGGYAGNIPGPGTAVDRGFAVTGTDTGHKADGVTARWALDNLERQVNYAYLAVHRTAETAKAVVRQYYSRDAHHAYFAGCSTGGRQGLMEAQRFPADFDGVVSGAPVYDWTRVMAGGIKNSRAAFPDAASLAKPIVTADSLKLLESSVLKACDANDGVTDGVIDDPPSCKFDVATLPACVVTRDPRAADDVRLFLLPGALHCAGGTGPSQFDPIEPIVNWVEKGAVPASMIVRKPAAGDQPARSRPVCPYPAKAADKGTGSTDDAANFVCK
jgi:tannase/feruloyl esterase